VRKTRGFTLLEMMVVVAISLLLIALLVPIFQLTTRTVRTVEVKLAVYEAARNILDVLDAQLRLAMCTERGEHFSIKGGAFQDTDPFTPLGSAKYKESRREAGSVHLTRLDCSGACGSMNNDMWYAGSQATFYDAWLFSIRSNLQYQSVWDVPTRAQKLQDVSLIGTRAFAFLRVAQAANFLAAGHEAGAPYWVATQSTAGISGVSLMDLDFAYWDAAAGTFEHVPDNSAVYFAPLPRAVRTTITVCDKEKRSRTTFCRITQLPCGSGDGVVTDAQDVDYAAPSPSPFNRTKKLSILNPGAYAP